MSLSKIELTCTASNFESAFTVGKRYPAHYVGSSVYDIRSNRDKLHSLGLDTNGNGKVWAGADVSATFKHLVTLKNESIEA